MRKSFSKYMRNGGEKVFTVIVMTALIVWAFRQIAEVLDLGNMIKKK